LVNFETILRIEKARRKFMSYVVESNLLQALDRRKVPEDFLSVAFAHLIQYLGDRYPGSFSLFLAWLLKREIDEHALRHIEALVQHPLRSIEEKYPRSNRWRPDITLVTSDQVTYIEVKRTDRNARRLGSQLRKYVDLAKTMDASSAGVLLISHYSPEPSALPTDDTFLGVKCWYEIADELSKLNIPSEDVVGHHLVNQFLEFLRQGGLAVGKVDKNVIDGLKSFMSLNTLIAKVLEECGAQSSKNYIDSGWSNWGFIMERVPCQLHIEFDDAAILTFYANPARRPRLAQALPTSGWNYAEDPDDPGWWYRVKDLADGDFFSLEAPGQVGSLTDFVKSCKSDLANGLRR
jgi:hypothetical protein